MSTSGRSDRLTRISSIYYAEHIADRRARSTGSKPRSTNWPRADVAFAVCTNKLEWLSKLLLDKLD